MGGCRDRDPPLAALRPLPGPAQRRRASSGPPPGGHRCSMAAAWAGSAPLTAATAAAAASAAAAAAAAAGPAPTRPSGAGPAPPPASRRSPPASHGAAAPSAPRAPLQPPRSVPLPPGGAGPLWKGCVCVWKGGGVEGGRCSPPFSAAGRGRGNGAGRARCCSTAASWGAPPSAISAQPLPAPPYRVPTGAACPPRPSCVPPLSLLCPLLSPLRSRPPRAPGGGAGPGAPRGPASGPGAVNKRPPGPQPLPGATLMEIQQGTARGRQEGSWGSPVTGSAAGAPGELSVRSAKCTPSYCTRGGVCGLPGFQRFRGIGEICWEKEGIP